MTLGMEKIIWLKLHENSQVIVVSGPWPPFCLVIFQRAVLYNFVLLGVGVGFKSTTSKTCRKIVILPFCLSFCICLYNDRNNVLNELCWPE